MQSERRCGARDVSVNDTGLNDSQTILGINVQDVAHARKFDDDTSRQCQRATRETCTGAARCEGHALLRQ